MNNLTFWTRVVCTLYLIAFVVNVVFGSRDVYWRDWFSGVVFAIAIYFLEPIFGKYLRRKKFFRR